uniref:Zinc finger CCCH domain-containing protein 14 n=1 Tax=Romanomermis culicivorax TaxID=13658 RepID=A0A915HKP1_ROMCU
MVMIANKKTKEQMTNDLNLFLGKNSEIFTEWVHKVLDRLQAISQKSTSAKSGSVASSSSVERDKKKSKKSSAYDKTSPFKAENDINKRRSSERRKDDVKKDIGDSDSKQKKKIDLKKEKQYKHDKTSRSTEMEIRSRSSYKGSESNDKTNFKYEDQNRSPKQSHKIFLTKNQKSECRSEDRPREDDVPAVMPPRNRGSRLSQRIGRTGTVRPFKRTSSSPIEFSSAHKRRSIVGQVVNRKVEEEAYEEAMRTTMTVSSTVRVTERKSMVPKAMQAKPSIFLKALCEANASVSRKRHLVDAG